MHALQARVLLVEQLLRDALVEVEVHPGRRVDEHPGRGVAQVDHRARGCERVRHDLARVLPLDLARVRVRRAPGRTTAVPRLRRRPASTRSAKSVARRLGEDVVAVDDDARARAHSSSISSFLSERSQ
jgi:hypothetical protein